MNLYKKSLFKFCSNKEVLPIGLKSQLDFLHEKNYCLEQVYPRKFTEKYDAIEYYQKDTISPLLSFKDKEVQSSIENGLLKTGWDLLDRGGKKWRPVLGLLVGQLLGGQYKVSDDILAKLMFLTEILHNASLIIDDIEDKSELRRNKPCVHLIYGEDVSINAGVSMMFAPVFSLFNSLNKEKVDLETISKINMAYLQELSALHVGQNLDIEMKYKRIPQIESYYDVVLGKTGVMPRLAIKWILSIVKREGLKNPEFNGKEMRIDDYLLNMSDKLSIAFQIKDDLLNLVPSKVAANKGLIGEDIYEGKQSLMVMHALHQNDNKRLKEILALKTKDQNLINEAISILKRLGSIDYAEKKMHHYFSESMSMCKNLDKVAKNKAAIDDIVELAHYLIDRM